MVMAGYFKFVEKALDLYEEEWWVRKLGLNFEGTDPMQWSATWAGVKETLRGVSMKLVIWICVLTSITDVGPKVDVLWKKLAKKHIWMNITGSLFSYYCITHY